MSDASTIDSDATRKLALEIRKLELESKNLGKPWFMQPPTLIALAALLASIAANVIQYSAAERARQLAEIRKERLELEATKLEQKTASLRSVALDLTREITQRDTENQLARDKAEAHQKTLQQLQQDIQSASVSRQQLLAQVALVQNSAAALKPSAPKPRPRQSEPSLEERNSILDLFKR